MKYTSNSIVIFGLLTVLIDGTLCQLPKVRIEMDEVGMHRLVRISYFAKFAYLLMETYLEIGSSNTTCTLIAHSSDPIASMCSPSPCQPQST